MHSPFDNWRWQPPAGWTRITTVDMHTGGEPLRIIVDGLPPLEGRTVLEKRRSFRERFDHLRTGIMWEPRGHADMYGAVVTSSVDADLDVFFLNNEGYSTMCGHAVLALTTLAFQTGLVPRTGDTPRLDLNVPAGRIRAQAVMDGDRVASAAFRNVPSFVYRGDEEIEIPGIGCVRYDLVYGGAFYAVVDAAPLGLELLPQETDQVIDYGRRIKRAVAAAAPITHPFESDLSFLYGTIFTGPAHAALHHSRNVCVFADGELDRSATGSGVSARAALHYARGELGLGTPITIESILGTTMTVSVAEMVRFGPYAAVIPEVSGTASITGRHEFYFDPSDPLARGFILR